jgi:hypothetical protein
MATKQTHQEMIERLAELAAAVKYGVETDTHSIAMESFGGRFKYSMVQICKQFIQDYECTTNAEKLMAEAAAVAYMRYLDASRRLNNCLDSSSYTSPEKNTYLSMLSKERDRSHRQYLSAVSMIRQIKAPPFEMKIKANTAFVSQNQQINVLNQETNESK